MALKKVFPDTSVCFPISVLDLLLRCDERDLHRIVWSEDLLRELERVWVRQGARTVGSAQAVTAAIRSTFPDQRIDRDVYASLIDKMPGDDPDDHCHAAAAVAVAPAVLLTANLRDFPAQPLGERGVTVLSPDEYAVSLLNEHREDLLVVVADMAAHRRRPPMDVDDVLNALARAGLTTFVDTFRAL
ncbi:MAG: hypothetical protein WBA45_12670 [Microthrixaceae bacterium]